MASAQVLIDAATSSRKRGHLEAGKKKEYFMRQKNRYTMFNDMEKDSVVRSLTVVIEWRMSRGLKMEVRTLDRRGQLSDVTRALGENSLLVDNVVFAKEDDSRWHFLHHESLVEHQCR